MAILELNKLTKTYPNGAGIDSIDLDVEDGAFYGILGPEKSGKTTLMRTVMRLLRPTSGSVAIFDVDVARDVPAVRSQIGYVPAQPYLDLNLTVKRYLRRSLRACGYRDDSELYDICQAFDLDPKLRLGSATEDEVKLAAIAAAILHKPKLLLLDEPSLDLDAYQRGSVFKQLYSLHEQGVTVVFSTRSAEEIRRFTTHAAILSEGTILASGVTSSIKALTTIKVNVSVAEDNYDFARALSIRNFSTAGDQITFIYEDSVDTLIKQLSAFTVNSFSITEAALDTVLFSLRERSERRGI